MMTFTVPSQVRLLIACFCLLWAASIAAEAGLPLKPYVPFDTNVKFLPAEQAFILSGSYDGGSHISLYWQIAEGYYLYKHRFMVQDVATSLPIKLTIPPGQPKYDEWFGDTEVYYRFVEILVPVSASSQGSKNWLLSYQGCADAGLCYPPEHSAAEFTVDMPGLALTDAGAATSAATEKSVWGLDIKNNTAEPLTGSEANYLAELLKDSSLAIALALFFVAGVGLAFTPCVLPMMPILSSVIVGHYKPGSANAVKLSVAYVLGMAVAYTIAGALAGLFGASLNIQAALQNAWLLGGVALLFVLLALSMFGLYSLRLPVWLENKLHQATAKPRGQLTSVAFMGAGSALLVSPCISAPLAGALIYISIQQDVLIGAAALFVLALGMGLPLILMGLGAHRFLPASGAWMDNIKVGLGFCLLGLAIWLLERLFSPALTLAAWGALALGFALWLISIQLQRLTMLARIVGVLLLGYGAVLLVVAATGEYRLLHPLAALRTDYAISATLQFTPATNQHVEALLQQQPVADRPAVVYFYADWCTTCRALERTAFANQAVRQRLAQLALFKADITLNTKQHSQWLDKFELFGPPALLFFDANGNELRQYRLQSEISAVALAAHLDHFLSAL